MRKPTFLKQKNMLRVLYALAPIAGAAIYFFGWRCAVVLVVCAVAAFATEWIMAQTRNGRISYACFVTAALYALSLPPTTPLWIAATGAVVAILFGKEVFGGFGKNVFNPAIVGRGFVYVCFPVELTSKFVPVFRGFPGGFARYSFGALQQTPDYLQSAGVRVADAITTATPMWARRDFGFITPLRDLISGSIGGSFTFKEITRVLAAGSMGEVCGILIIMSAVYLIVTKTAQWRLMAATVSGALSLNVFLRFVLGIEAVPPPAFTLFSGALLYASVFMVTDPVSAPKRKESQWIYGFFIGAMIVFFRYKSIFAGGVGFAILLGNMLAPSLDLWLKRFFDAGTKGKQA